jgi:hypothetical protein
VRSIATGSTVLRVLRDHAIWLRKVRSHSLRSLPLTGPDIYRRAICTFVP